MSEPAEKVQMYEFKVIIRGKGTTADKAFLKAVDAFAADPGDWEDCWVDDCWEDDEDD